MDEAPFAGRTLHFIGIGGAGMSGLALVARELGASVSGSDRVDSPALERLRPAAVHHRLGPAAEDVDVAAVVHQLGRARARRPCRDLAEDRLAVGLAEPLHVGEAGVEAERLQHAQAELDAAL